MADFTNTGTFISASKAKTNLSKYLKDEGKEQLSPNHPDHVFGHVFGLTKIKDLISKIDQYNLNEADAAKHIKGLRIYRSKTKSTDDVMIVPITKDGKDHPGQIHGGLSPKKQSGKPMILSGAGPCPNQCP